MKVQKKLVTGVWSEEEIELLKKIFTKKSGQEVAAALGRCLASVRQKAHKLRLCRKFYRTWTQDEISRFREIFPGNRSTDVARMLNRSVNSIREKAHRIGLRKKKGHLKAINRRARIGK